MLSADVNLNALPSQTRTIFLPLSFFQQRNICSSEERGYRNKIILKGESTRRPADWKAFLSNEENKQQFIKLLLEVWSKDSFA